MSATLQHKAVLTQKVATSNFYDSKSNPVINAFNEESKLFRQLIRKTSSVGKTKHGRKAEAQSTSRGSDSLFKLWNSFEGRLPKVLYQQKLIEMGDFLVSIKEYNLAVWQCYGRYLDEFGDQHIEDIVDIKSVKHIFFPDGLETDHASLTFRALYGKSICNYQLVLQSDSQLQNTESVSKCLKLLAFLRLITQIVLNRETLCWLVYNGTIHIYSVSRHMMTLGHSSKVLEYLLWACMCMENSVPLLAVRYLPWRSTLYTAVCQCYYDCKAGPEAESFARRALSKVNDLSQLEKISSAAFIPQIEDIFRQAAVKLGIMVYKRTVFDTRKRPKGLLRPKTRSNIKDAQSPTEVRVMTLVASDGRLIWHKTSKQRLDDLYKKPGSLPWPRTPVEKLLSDMFEGSAAQFLALLDTLSDSTRRTLLTSPPAADSDDYILDTFTEMFFAGMEIISGGGGKNPRTAPSTISDVTLSGVVLDRTLMEMASAGEDGVTLSAVVKFVKWAYNYEQWEVYDLLMALLLEKIKSLESPEYAADLKALELIECMEVVNVNRKTKKQAEEYNEAMGTGTQNISAQVSHRTVSTSDEMVQLAEVLHSCIQDTMAESIDRDMMVDATLFLWSKCKAVFQKFQTGATDSGKYLQRMDQPGKWVHILNIIHEVMYWCGLNNVDPGVTAEVAIRLALVLENNAAQDTKQETDRKQPGKEGDNTGIPTSAASKSPTKSIVSEGPDVAIHVSTSLYTATILVQGAREQLLTARGILVRALQGMSLAREAVALTDGKSISDISWMKDNKTTDDDNPEGVHNILRDLHLELLFMYHRVCIKLVAMGPDPASLTRSKFKRSTNKKSPVEACSRQDDVESIEELEAKCKKNNIYKALFLMQKSLQSFKQGHSGQVHSDGTPKQFLKDAMALITKAQDEEYKLYKQNTTPKNTSDNSIPPPPVLLCRTDRTMVFKPGVFNPQEKVGWYSLFGCTSAGSNVKVRLSDSNIPGTGQQVPAYDCHLSVSGLVANEKYVFAVAAYTVDGKLIGGSIGHTSKPIMASHTMPILMSWAFLSQVAYQVGCYDTSQQATSVLWDHFVAVPKQRETDVTSERAQQDFELTLRRLNTKTASEASPVLLRMFLTSIFIYVDVNTRSGAIYCNKLSDEGPYYKGQLLRMRECERMLVALELAGWLNESNLALQAVVQCYGLLAPIMHYKIPSVPVIQIVTFCHAVLQEIPSSLLVRRQQTVCDNLHHMVATITYHMAKVLRVWKQRPLANMISDSGKKMLAVEKESEKPKAQETVVEFAETDENAGGAQSHRKKKVKRGGLLTFNVEGPQNEELRALEAHMLKLSKLAHSTNELTGSEDPNILHAFIATLPSRHAYKEVVKFRRRARYLEFFVQVMQKALSEGLVDIATEWCDETKTWLLRRNEHLSSAKLILTKQQGALTVAGDDPKKFAAAAIEFSKINKSHLKSPDGKSPRKKRKKFQLLVHVRSNQRMSEAAKASQEEKELKSFEILDRTLPEFYRTMKRRQRLRNICSDELPWRCQLNILQGLCFFAQFLNKVEKRNKLLGPTSGDIYRSSYIDNEWITFETSGTLVVGWDGGPSRAVTRQDDTREGANDAIIKKLHQINIGKQGLRVHQSAIEVAAAATVGGKLKKLPPPPDDKQSDSVPTYRSTEVDRPGRQERHHNHQEYNAVSLQALTNDLNKAFNNLKRAVVLAHRGQHWTLLQNAARAMWNCAHTALLYSFAGGYSSGIFSVEAIRSIVCQPFFVAADCILDMLNVLQNDSRSKSKKSMKDMVNSDLMGTVTDELGGASLKFEKYMDDCSMVDKHWIRRIVLRVLEMLYYEQQWERLADLAMRFNVLTNERYSEQVGPLICQAQQKLRSRVKAYGGPEPPQNAFKFPDEITGEPITVKNYMNVHLISSMQDRELEPLDMGGRIDPEGHNVYGGARDAMKLVCVPLDVTDSLQNFRQALDTCYYTSRALQHSRKLLVLYLAGQQICSSTSRQSHVDFTETDDNTQGDVPPDLKNSEFTSMSEIQTPALPRSQLAVVMSSYTKTIEMLLSRKHKDLAAQGSHELGNLYYHAGNSRAAYKWWSEGLDLILLTSDTLSTWRQVLGKNSEDDISTQLLQRCGMWGCLLGAILASKIAQYILTSDLGLRMESCFLSAYLFKAIFRTSLPHPTADRDYALYDIGEGCEVQYLVPGVDLLSDRFRCEARTLVSSLRWVTEELFRGRHNLLVLPLLTLYNYFTTFICRDLQRAIDGRILKMRILTDLGLFTEALTVLAWILNGERLPQTADSNFRLVSTTMTTLKFNTTKPVTDAINLKILNTLVEKRLSPSLATLYGPHLTCHLSLAQSHLMIVLADTIPVLPSREEAVIPDVAKETRKTSSAAGSSICKVQTSVLSRKAERDAKIIITPRLTIEDALATSSVDEASVESVKVRNDNGRFSLGKNSPSLEKIKGVLLSTAERFLHILVDCMEEKGTESLHASELELVILGKLELGSIYCQHQLASKSASIVASAMLAIQSSSLFKEIPTKKTTTSFRTSSMKGSRQHIPPLSLYSLDDDNEDIQSSHFQYQNSQSRARLDGRLWLNSRLMLVKNLMTGVKGMGRISDVDCNKLELSECRDHCMQGLTEAEACGDIELQAEFLMQGALLDLQEGRSLSDVKETLKEVIDLLNDLHTLSPEASLLLCLARTHLTDLEALVIPEDENMSSAVQTTLQSYCTVQHKLLQQLKYLGECIEIHNVQPSLSSLAFPFQNIHLPHILLLVKLKMRIGHTLAREASLRNELESTNMWRLSGDVLASALSLGKLCVRTNPTLQAEILLNFGKVEQQLFKCGLCSCRSVVDTLIQAISTSFTSNHDLQLIKEAYLEIAEAYLKGSNILNMPVKADDGPTTMSQQAKPSSSAKKSNKKVSKQETIEKERERERTKESHAAWQAVCAATLIAQAQRRFTLLIGDATLTTIPAKDAVRNEIPGFLKEDLMVAAEQGLDDLRVHSRDGKNVLDPVTEGSEDYKWDAKMEEPQLTWRHLISYTSILQRMCSMSAVGINDCLADDKKTADDKKLTEDTKLLDVEISTAADIGTSRNVVRLPLLADTAALRLKHMHSFLSTHLSVYASECGAIYPPPQMHLAPIEPAVQPDIPIRNVKEKSPAVKEPVKYNNKIPALKAAKQLCVQWYRSALTSPSNDTILLLYTYTSKTSSTVTNETCAKRVLQYTHVTFLHKKLVGLKQNAEMSLSDKPKVADKQITPPSTGKPSTRKSKRTARISQLSAKVQRDENLESQLKQCMVYIQNLLTNVEVEPSAIEIPFDVSLDVIRSLQMMFDPLYGGELTDPQLIDWILPLVQTTQELPQ